MMVDTVLLLLLLSLYAGARGHAATLYVTPQPGTPCPGEGSDPCHTLNEYAHNMSEYLSANITFLFLPGTHFLDIHMLVNGTTKLTLQANSSDSIPTILCADCCAVSALNVSWVTLEMEDFLIDACHFTNSELFASRASGHGIIKHCSFKTQQIKEGSICNTVTTCFSLEAM